MWLWVVAAAIVILFGVYWYEDEIKGYPPPWQTSTTNPETEKSAGIANPASTNCVTLGGTLEIKDDAASGGEVGYCHLKDGRVCEEWSLFRGGCTAPTNS